MRRRAFASTAHLLAAAGLLVGFASAVLPIYATECGGPRTVPLDRWWPGIRALKGSSLVDLDLRGDNVSGVTFTACDFHRSTLAGANLRGTRLWDCDLREANLEGADLRGALYDRKTRWPAGFDPWAAGAVLLDR